MKTIEIIVSAKGETSVQTRGFTGSSCREASQFIEQALNILPPSSIRRSLSSNISSNSPDLRAHYCCSFCSDFLPRIQG